MPFQPLSGCELDGRGEDEACSPTDPYTLELDRSLLDQATACVDPDRAGVDASPYNDTSSSRIFVPVAPTDGPPQFGNRYLFRLAAISVAAYTSCRVRGLRQAIGIGVMLERPDPPGMYPVEIDQTSPFWAFQDGNVSWHLRFIPGASSGPFAGANLATPGISLDVNGTSPGRIVRYPDASGAPFRGRPPGKEIGALGTFRDLRYPWGFGGQVSLLDFEVQGPGTLAFFCSVKQTNPATRQQLATLLPPGTPTNVLSREDQFLLAFPDAIYRHVSGAILCEFGQMHRRPGASTKQGNTPCG